MRSAATPFRSCPSCGRRFGVQLVSREPVASEVFEDDRTGPFKSGSPRRREPLASTPRPLSVTDVENFRYTYRCGRCGHGWTETRETRHRVREPKGYTGD